MALPTRIINTFAGQNWLITPAARALNQAPSNDIHAQEWLLTLSGVAIVNLEGNSEAAWLQETLILQPTIVDPMNYAIAIHSIPRPSGTEGVQYALAFQVEQLAPYASISSIFNQGVSNNSGFAVDVWRPNHYDTGIDAFSHQPVNNLYTGLQVDVAVRDTDAWLYRVGYTIALLGKIVFLAIPQTLFRSNFNATPISDPPSAVQEVGTAAIEGPRGSVTVIAPPAPPPDRWMRISRPPTTPTAPPAGDVGFRGIFTQISFDGVYTCFVTMFMTPTSGIASISFEDGSGGEFLHLDFLGDNKVRMDDLDSTQFGSFPRSQPFLVQVTLTISASPAIPTAVQIALSGNGASGAQNYTIAAPFQHLARQFGAIRVWQGFDNSGAFDATHIVVTRA